MKRLTNLLFVIKFLLLGGLLGLAILFFLPKSPLSFNWQEAKNAWHFYQQNSLKQPSVSSQASTPFSYEQAVSIAGPSVVSVKAYRQGRARPATDGHKGDMLVDISVAVGSGVVFDNIGHIVTNYHVIAGSVKVDVGFADGRRKYAQIVGFDRFNDIAVLKVDIDTPQAAVLGQSSEAKTGDLIMAIGTPFGKFKNSVTLGIISGIEHGPLEPRIQTDASINYGNSGGALINARGEVIGISSNKFSIKNKGELGINFGIPIDVVKESFEQILTKGIVTRNWLGVRLNQLNLEGRRHFGTGLLVSNIEKGSPGEEAGLQPEDLLVKFDGEAVEKIIHFRKLFIAVPVGKEVEIEILRNKKPLKLTLKLREKT